MERKIIVLVLCLAFISSIVFAQTDEIKTANTVTEGNISFAIDLYKKLGEKGGNLFFSPYSISTALAVANWLLKEPEIFNSFSLMMNGFTSINLS